MPSSDGFGTTKVCANCKWFDNSMGTCNRFPMTVQVIGYNSSWKPAETAFPIIPPEKLTTYWCGEWTKI